MTHQPSSANDLHVVPHDLLVRLHGWLTHIHHYKADDMEELEAILKQPPALGGEPGALPNDWRSLADQLQEVGLAYWKAHHRERGPGAVKFLHNDETGALFVVTRGEYAQELKDFIFSLDGPAQPPAPVTTQEPLAWMVVNPDDPERHKGIAYSQAVADKHSELGWTVTPLYRHAQPATAKVVLPERRKADGWLDITSQDRGWNACLDEVAKLNTPQ